MYRVYPRVNGRLGGLMGTGIPAAPLSSSVMFRHESFGRLEVSHDNRSIEVPVGEATSFLYHPEVEAIYLTKEEYGKIKESVRWYSRDEEDIQGVVIHSMTLISKVPGRGYGIKMETNRGAFISFVRWTNNYFYWDTFQCQKI